MNTRLSCFFAACLSFALTPACALDTDHMSSGLYAAVDCSVTTDSTCPPWICGSNSPDVNTSLPGVLRTDGTLNCSGFRVLGIEVANAMYSLTAARGHLLAIDENGSGADSNILQGEALIGSTIVLEDSAQTEHQIRIADYKLFDVEPWHADLTMHGYRLQARDNNGVFVDLCATPANGLGAVYANIDKFSLVVTDEFFNAKAEVMAQPGAFQFACPGQALSKMKWMGYSRDIPEESAFFTTPEQRQATVRMIIADYCGDGNAYTVSGQAVYWQNSSAWISVAGAETEVEVEARWNADGAICVTTPRYVPRSNIVCDDRVIPTCLDNDTQAYEWITRVDHQG